MSVATTQPIDRPESTSIQRVAPASFKIALLWAAAAVAAFHAGYLLSGYWMFAYLLSLWQVARHASARAAFYLGLGIGFLAAAPQLHCFWQIFGPSAIVLWLIVGFWIALFVLLARLAVVQLGEGRAAFLIPFLWTGLEYFRSELYYLKFSWLNFGYAFAGSALMPLLKWIGIYGLGFLSMAAVVLISRLRLKKAGVMALRLALGVVLVLFALAYRELGRRGSASGTPLKVVGIQMEFPTEYEILTALDRWHQTGAPADLLVLSEYTLNGPVPESIKGWCRDHRQYLVVGGKEPAPGGDFDDTAYVVGPAGEIVFRQVKSVPIQFMKDGRPALEQRIWDSPWGKIGFCVCYDLSYSRVTDRLIRLGARAIVVPTMDVIEWGKWEHQLHARVGLVRAAEYGVPVVRVASSGISQVINAAGNALATGSFPGPGEVVGGTLLLGEGGTLPVDRWLGFFATCVAAVWLAVGWQAGKWLGRVGPGAVGS